MVKKTRQLPSKNIDSQVGKFSKRGIFTSSEKQRIPLYSEGIMGEKFVVAQLFCEFLAEELPFRSFVNILKVSNRQQSSHRA